VFFLHHTQLDRLWWLWQQKHGVDEYNGPKEQHSKIEASLIDEIPMEILGRPVLVEKVMTTESDILCYKY